MPVLTTRFTEVLEKARCYAEDVLKLSIIDTSDLDPYFKGDLDGVRIWIASAIDDEEELFNILHLVGHSVQWNLNNELRALGSVLHLKPDDKTLHQLQEYEWEANCYGLCVLHKLNVYDLDTWYSEKYKEDMHYLTHFYKTGEKLREITDLSKFYEFNRPLIEKNIPAFFPKANPERRTGIVIDFTNTIKKS
ncbi:MAG TPA: hypothetical protein VHQ93_10850 [Chitinophagaceae bacterium]|jgi:hypothetical protein|nr:hypothetical protein [Chitinophagaceae bacterium]